MERKKTVAIIILVLFVVMFFDFRINGSEVFESYFRQMETKSFHSFNNFPRTTTGNVEVSKEVQMVVEDVDQKELQLYNEMGSIIITGEDRNDVELEAEITVYADEEQIAEDFLEGLDIQNRLSDSRMEILLQQKVDRKPAIKGVKVDYILKVPRKMTPDLRNKYGKMDVRDFNSNPILSNQYDQLLVASIDGDPEIDSRYGQLTVRKINGFARIETAYNSAMLADINNGVNIEGRYSRLEMKNIAGDSIINSRYGGLFLEGLEGDLQFDSRFTGISFSDIEGRISGENEYGDIRIRGLRNDVDLESRFADVHLDLRSGFEDFTLDCSTRFGNIRTNLNLDKQQEDNRESVKQTFGEGTVNIRIDTDHADITINK